MGKNPLEEMELKKKKKKKKKWSSPISPQKGLRCSTWMQSQKQQNNLCLVPGQTIQYHNNPSLCPDQ